MQAPRSHTRLRRFIKDIILHTPFTKMVYLLITLWLLFSTALYLAERGTEAATLHSFSEALYWGVAAFSTAGIADTPSSGAAQLIEGALDSGRLDAVFRHHRRHHYHLFLPAHTVAA